MTILVKRVIQNSIEPVCPARLAAASLLGAHSRSAAGPSDTDLDPSGIEA